MIVNSTYPNLLEMNRRCSIPIQGAFERQVNPAGVSVRTYDFVVTRFEMDYLEDH